MGVESIRLYRMNSETKCKGTNCTLKSRCNLFSKAKTGAFYALSPFDPKSRTCIAFQKRPVKKYKSLAGRFLKPNLIYFIEVEKKGEFIPGIAVINPNKPGVVNMILSNGDLKYTAKLNEVKFIRQRGHV